MKNSSIALLIITVLLAVMYGILGYFYSTFYQLELIVLPLVFVISAILTFLLSWVKPLREWKHLLFPSFCILFFILLIADHLISRHKTTVVLRLPQDYTGMVHLLPTEEKVKKAEVNSAGISYVPWKGDYKLKVIRGESDISNVLNESGHGELRLSDGDSTHYRTLSISCFEVTEEGNYPERPWNQKHAACMDSLAFDSLYSAGLIQIEKLHFQRWTLQP